MSARILVINCEDNLWWVLFQCLDLTEAWRHSSCCSMVQSPLQWANCKYFSWESCYTWGKSLHVHSAIHCYSEGARYPGPCAHAQVVPKCILHPAGIPFLVRPYWIPLHWIAFSPPGRYWIETWYKGNCHRWCYIDFNFSDQCTIMICKIISVNKAAHQLVVSKDEGEIGCTTSSVADALEYLMKLDPRFADAGATTEFIRHVSNS